MISYDDFKKVEVKVGKILSAEKVEKADKLLKLSVDFGLKPFAEQKVSPLGRSVAGLAEHSDSGVLGLKTVVQPAQAPEASPAPVEAGASSVTLSTTSSSVPTEIKVPDIRQIVSGIAEYYPDPQVLIGITCMFVTNLEPRVIRGLESQGMIFAVGGGDQPLGLLVPNAPVAPGTQAK